ncbi:MAG: prevent-host-death family protein [Gammaproteobacteria bacterium]|nr:prevent-host-death family protein [Gammaproteobacteria bacterium]
MKATTKDLRLHTNEVLAATDRGETVVITYRGRCRAVLTRWQSPADEPAGEARNPAFGLWSDRNGDVAGEVRRIRQPREFQ